MIHEYTILLFVNVILVISQTNKSIMYDWDGFNESKKGDWETERQAVLKVSRLKVVSVKITTLDPNTFTSSSLMTKIRSQMYIYSAKMKGFFVVKVSQVTKKVA